MPAIVLASTSPYRRQLLERLLPEFICAAPDADETPLPREQPQALAERLAQAKALSLAKHYQDAIIIGSDQVASCQGNILGKPGTHSQALAQLLACQGQRVTFYTGLCLHHTQSGKTSSWVEPFHVHFRQLSQTQLENYLLREQPYDCAGSFKMEGLGIALFERLEGDDPNALIGLPLIRLVSMLSDQGVNIL